MALPVNLKIEENISEKKEQNLFAAIEKIQKNLVQYEERVKELTSKISTSSNGNQSHNKLASDLAKAQSEMRVAATDSINPYFKSKYADLTSIVQASRPFLSKYGISVTQTTKPDKEGRLFLYSRLYHSSGQWIESTIEVKPPKSDIHTLGSYLTYLRRYQYASLVGVVASDEDDDGETVMKDPTQRNNYAVASSKITKAQLQVLSNELSSDPEILESLLKGFSISKISDLPSKHYTKCIERIRGIKRAKEN